MAKARRSLSTRWKEVGIPAVGQNMRKKTSNPRLTTLSQNGYGDDGDGDDDDEDDDDD